MIYHHFPILDTLHYHLKWQKSSFKEIPSQKIILYEKLFRIDQIFIDENINKQLRQEHMIRPSSTFIQYL